MVGFVPVFFQVFQGIGERFFGEAGVREASSQSVAVPD
jgi:hypothetical protein